MTEERRRREPDPNLLSYVPSDKEEEKPKHTAYTIAMIVFRFLIAAVIAYFAVKLTAQR